MLSFKLLAPFFVVSILFLHSHIPIFSLHKIFPGFATSHPYCVVYDRPPRTGSSSISAALRRCLATHGYEQPKLSKTILRDQFIRAMMASPHDRVALVTRHVYISPEDLQILRNGCQRLFYISSAASMRGRLWSAAKYSFVGRNYDGEITGDMVKAATDVAMNNTDWEPFLEDYPYLQLKPGSNRATAAWGVQSDGRMVPDYVIRKESLEEDLVAVLKQLNCDTSEREMLNVHKVKGKDKVPRIPLARGDGLFRWLDALAQDENAAGLEKLSEFAAEPEDRD